ncbi:ornithine carbamoyltransferase [Paraglaciecola psychrophila]|uniref:Ornithine carbamoyltransferase n=1 Tax=Paraglaciecola psychrophila 170 TaxID=1129794 RepID=K6ZRS9_9ALTE|nr:ornithine carbamoyltransferase [Paraglaciecola psychrophila]AGH46644.1 ornithine carbamoyltransferase [Paraglaciecola psychrophila 170]GAC38641.1 ornithine carbamoyltransferase [Paraglaciecola psychrophila 170]
MKQDLLSFKDWTAVQLHRLLTLAKTIKTNPAGYRTALDGLSIVALFEKPSLRTRVSFDIGINKLGGHLVYLDSQSNKLAGREDVKDMGANLACWADAIVARVFAHSTLEELAKSAKVPVINALCDMYHPCQAIADYLTISEHYDDLSKVKLAYIGDGNNVTHSLMLVGVALGCEVVVITPKGYEVDENIIKLTQARAQQFGGKLTVSTDINAANGSQVLYTDTWLSMGDETPLADIKDTFAGYEINEALMEKTGAEYVLHCQPAHRDLEISGSLIDSDASLLMQQAENRMHGQNAILVHLLASDFEPRN